MSIKVVKEYERAVIFRLGRLLGAKGPGLFFIIPFIDSMVKVDLRIVTADVPEQRIITKDNVTVGVDAVVYYKVFDPVKAVTRIENYHYGVLMLAQTTLRDVIGQVELDDLLTKRDEINKKLQEYDAKEAEMKKELETASRIQRMLIPDLNSLPQNKNFNVFAYYLPHFELGGDLYDFGMISNKEFYFAIADVSGKGLSAALLMSNFQANLRAQFSLNIKLEDIIKNLNEAVLKNSKGAHFITMFVGKYNFLRKRLIYVNAGHHPPILYDKTTKKISLLRKGCVGIGMLDEIPEIEVGKIRIQNPSKLLLYTDGVSEISLHNQADFGFRKLQQIVASDLDIRETIEKIITVLRLYKDNPKLFDDVTLLGFDFN
jgi:serine phosphatase RsbU (regulator of sigma subunit)